jgi:predicted nucleic acid-binding protein
MPPFSKTVANTERSSLVLDAWAIMAWLKGQEPAAGRVRTLLEAAGRENKLLMNIVNLGEVFYLSVKAKDLAYGERVLQNLRARVHIIPAPDGLVLAAAALKARHPISYAAAFAAATAMDREVPLVTGDLELRSMAARENRLTLEWIGAAGT